MTLTEHPAQPQGREKKPRRKRLLMVVTLVLAILAGYTVWSNAIPYTLSASIEIDATPDEVWSVLTDLDAYNEWNPFIVSSGGSRLTTWSYETAVRSLVGTENRSRALLIIP